MTTVEHAVGQVAAPRGILARPTKTTGFTSWLTTIDHKRIGIMYGAVALVFFVIGGLEALGVEHVKPIITRGILIDIAGYFE